MATGGKPPGPAVTPRLYTDPAAQAFWRARFPDLEVVAGSPPEPAAEPCVVASAGGLDLHAGDGLPPWRPEPVKRWLVSRDSLLARATGVTGGAQPQVLDAMAGWGGDGLELVALGARVDLVEASPLVHAVLVERAAASALEPASIRCRDAWAVMQSDEWDVIVLDPMFPERGRKGLAKRPLQILQRLAVADDRPLADWLALAIRRARSRVVVKRRRTETVLGKPAWQIQGTTIRFDIYRPALQP